MTVWKAGLFSLEISGGGEARIWVDGKAAGEFAPVGRMVAGRRIHEPDSARIEADGIRLFYPCGTVLLALRERGSHVTLTVVSMDGDADAWIWGPYRTGLNEGYGEVVGAAWSDEYAVGIQSLGPKTVGGFPGELAGEHPFADEIAPHAGTHESAQGSAVLSLTKGAALQAYARDRGRPARRDYLYARGAWVTPVDGEDAHIAGTAIALYGCRRQEILDTIGRIELAEGLPHPLVDGEWGKTSPRANASYLMTEFGEDTIDKAVAYAEAAGLACVYHPDPFENWGHFQLKRNAFPHGDDGMRECVRKAAARGVHIGLHTLSNFTTPNDPYVTPVPHPRLLKMGETALLSDIGERDGAIGVEDGAFFTRLSALNAVRIGDELIRYAGVEACEGGSRLTGCERGAWGTRAACHAAGRPVARLWDHDYRTLFPDAVLQREYSKRLGELFVGTGMLRMSFDGIEGCAYTGHDEYACSRFVQDCYDLWGPQIRCDASGLSHYRWHTHTYMNWGEPWYTADMRRGMHAFRTSNQAYYRRNFFPPMMGWYALKLAARKYEATTPDDMEWMLSKAAGYGAGFTFNVGMDALEAHGLTSAYLDLIRKWEALRLSGNVPSGLREEMRDPGSEWHIEERENGWAVYRAILETFECSPEGRREGVDTTAFWMIYNPYHEQPVRIRIRMGDGRDRGSVLALSLGAGEESLSFRATIDPGQYLLYDGGNCLEIRDVNFNLLGRAAGEGAPLRLSRGISMLRFTCRFAGEEPPYPQAKVTIYDGGTFIPR